MTTEGELRILEEIRTMRAEIARLGMMITDAQRAPVIKTKQVAAIFGMTPRQVRAKLVLTEILVPVEGTSQFFHRADVDEVKTLIQRGAIPLR